MKSKTVIGIYNRKGGVGKTFCTANLAGQLAMDGKRVLVLDGDSQINLTQYFLSGDPSLFDEDGDMREDAQNIDKILEGEVKAVNAIRHLSFNRKKKIDGKYRTVTCRIDIIPGSPDLDYIDVKDVNIIENELDALEYDVVLIDFPPQNSVITMAYMYACNQIVVPMELAKQTSFSGYRDVMKRFMNVIQEYGLEDVGLSCFFNGVWLYKEDQKQVYEESLTIAEDLGLFESTIRFDYSGAQNSAALNAPLCISSGNAPITEDFKKLADEMTRRFGL